MTIILSSVQPARTDAGEHADVIVHIQARVVAAGLARRKVNGWLITEVGDRLLAGEPELLVDERLVWRVPVQWASPTKGVLAQQVVQVLVDAVSGELMPNSPSAQEIRTACRSPCPFVSCRSCVMATVCLHACRWCLLGLVSRPRNSV